ncbi:hypothetical protein [Kitasatospora purpeofusca]|uniref:Uncharacterized protein n=1 Tax=Kitasatospora purpeofusca TaxID=67352 RepID=A0ABZ1UBA8_9ACTN|nr:hypothetical protein [Kitasatospora purpeofusca]
MTEANRGLVVSAAQAFLALVVGSLVHRTAVQAAAPAANDPTTQGSRQGG